jgi:hypothetical protein
MSARNELLGYMATTIGTIVVLFGLQHWYASYLDVHVVHGELADAPMNEALEQQRTAESQALAGGKLSLSQAKEALASRGRVFPPITPRPSDDLSAMSGWVRRKGFAPYAPRKGAVPAAPVAEPEPASESDASPATDEPAGQAPDGVEQAPVPEADGVPRLAPGRALPGPGPQRGATETRRIRVEPGAARPARHRPEPGEQRSPQP